MKDIQGTISRLEERLDGVLQKEENTAEQNEKATPVSTVTLAEELHRFIDGLDNVNGRLNHIINCCEL